METLYNTPYGKMTGKEIEEYLDKIAAKVNAGIPYSACHEKAIDLKVGETVMDKVSRNTGKVHSIDKGVTVDFGNGYFKWYSKDTYRFFLVGVNDYISKLNKKYEVDCQGDDRYKIEAEWYDTVNKPKHYMLFPEHNIEVRDLMKLLAAQLDYHEDYSAMLISDYIQAMQYLLRWHNKNGVEDIKKAKWYLDKIIEELEENL